MRVGVEGLRGDLKAFGQLGRCKFRWRKRELIFQAIAWMRAVVEGLVVVVEVGDCEASVGDLARPGVVLPTLITRLAR